MKIAIFGNGGHASEIADICEAVGYDEICYIVRESDLPTSNDSSQFFPESEVELLHQNGYSFAIGIADGILREKIFKKYSKFDYPNLIHPLASFGRNQLKEIMKSKGIIIAAGVRFMSSIEVGSFSIFGLNCTVGHDCIISNYVSIMPGVNISGNVLIGKSVSIGSGAVILPGNTNEKITLNNGLQVGAGAVVTKSFFNSTIIKGVPARDKSP